MISPVRKSLLFIICGRVAIAGPSLGFYQYEDVTDNAWLTAWHIVSTQN